MNVDALRPHPATVEPFRRDRLKFVPASSGCYVLTTLAGRILYVGLATTLRTRMGQHLDNAEKTGMTAHGRALLFHWLETANLQATERGWLNMHELATGVRPILNKMDSPISY